MTILGVYISLLCVISLSTSQVVQVAKMMGWFDMYTSTPDDDCFDLCYELFLNMTEDAFGGRSGVFSKIYNSVNSRSELGYDQHEMSLFLDDLINGIGYSVDTDRAIAYGDLLSQVYTDDGRVVDYESFNYTMYPCYCDEYVDSFFRMCNQLRLGKRIRFPYRDGYNPQGENSGMQHDILGDNDQYVQAAIKEYEAHKCDIYAKDLGIRPVSGGLQYVFCKIFG